MNHHCRSELFQNNVLGTSANVCGLSSNGCCQNQAPIEEACTEECLKEMLCCCIGKMCACEFQIHDELETKTGILEKVGDNFLLLRSTNNQKIMFCDLCQLRFVTVTC